MGYIHLISNRDQYMAVFSPIIMPPPSSPEKISIQISYYSFLLMKQSLLHPFQNDIVNI